MKILVVYYSFDGNTRFIAEEIAKIAGGDLLGLQVKSAQEPKHNFMKYLWGGKQVFQKLEPELVPFNCDVSAYDLMFIGTPVWAWTYAPALNSFFSRFPFTGKKVALFCCSGGQPRKTLEKMRDRLGGNECLGNIHFREPLRFGKDAAAAQAREWATLIVELGGR